MVPAMNWTEDIPAADIKVGDHCFASIPTTGNTITGATSLTRRCEVVEVRGPILLVRTKTRKKPVPIDRAAITGNGWGYR